MGRGREKNWGRGLEWGKEEKKEKLRKGGVGRGREEENEEGGGGSGEEKQRKRLALGRGREDKMIKGLDWCREERKK